MRRATTTKYFLDQTYFNFWRFNAGVLSTWGHKAKDFGANNGGLGIFGGTLTLQTVHTRHDGHCMQRRHGLSLGTLSQSNSLLSLLLLSIIHLLLSPPCQPHPLTFLFRYCKHIDVGTLGAEASYDLTTATTAGYGALGRLGATTTVGGLGGCCWG